MVLPLLLVGGKRGKRKIILRSIQMEQNPMENLMERSVLALGGKNSPVR